MFCHRLAEFISNDLAHASIIAFSLLKKQNQMNFERETSQSQFFFADFISDMSKNLKKSARSFKLGGHFHHDHWQPDTLILLTVSIYAID